MERAGSVTRFGAKFHHFGKISKALDNFVRVYFVFGKKINLGTKPNLMLLGKFLLLFLAKYWTNTLAIWSHCLADCLPTMQNSRIMKRKENVIWMAF